jgi:beta-glucanase (GH16 family)
MKVKFSFLIFFLFFSCYTYSQNWNLIWNDEFNGSELDTTKWIHEIGTGSQYGLYGWGNSELQYYQPQNTIIDSGYAKIIAMEEPNGIIDSWNTAYYYSSSKITTMGLHDFKYGKIQAKIKTVDGEGFWPAFWMLPTNGSWPCDGEIDIMEQWGNSGLTHTTTGAAHVGLCPFSQGQHAYNSFQNSLSSGSYADDFHIYEIRWDVGYIAWYIDGVQVYFLTPSMFPSQYTWPFDSNNWYLMLNLAITSSGPNSNTIFPSQILVDWVRVYENVGLTPGCTDINAQNYNPNADIDNYTCEYVVNFVLDVNCSSISSPNQINISGPSVNWSCQSNYILDDTNGDDIWIGSFIITEGNFEYLYCSDNWSQSENLVAYGQSSGDWSCMPITDYTNYANRVIDIQSDTIIYNSWGSCQDCISGCTDPGASNYNINAFHDDGSCLYNTSFSVTFQLDMNNFNLPFTNPEINGNFNGWCGNCWSMTDYDGDNIWDYTVFLNSGTYEFKFSTDNWTFQESLSNIGNCIVNSWGYHNRLLSISSDTVLDVVCWESCSSCLYLGCTDPAASNYDANATIDDGSCSYVPSLCTGSAITGLSVSDIIHDRATFNFDNMNTYDATGAQVCRVDQIRIKYRPVGTSSWSQKNMAQPTGYDAVTGICNSTQNTAKITRNLMSSTTYEWEVKVWYCDGQNSGFVAGPNFTTADDCPNVGNLTAYGATPTKATFAWDNSNGAYSFVRLKARVDSISNPTGSDFFQIGGAGVSYGIYTKNKQNMVPGETYRGQARTYCDPNGGPYRSPSWSPLVFWTQPTVRIEGGVSIANLDVYPNPSEGTFNISFSSETIQSIDIRIMNVMGEEIVSEKTEQFIGEYTKKITLENQSKGIYFLEIKTKNEIIKKKIILQ